MSSLRLDQASFAHDDLRPILDHADLHLESGWTGLVGPNGAGKTTVLRILAGELPCAGRRASAGLRIHRLNQRIDTPSDAVEALGAAWDKSALRWMSRLDLDPVSLDRWATLSPGERRRWQVAAARWRKPDVLLLDEPDNHLDVDARQQLVEGLEGFRGIGVLVSHDRALLDAVTVRTAHLAAGRITTVDLPYSGAEAVFDAERQALLDALEQARLDERRTRRRLHAAHQQAASASRSRSLRHVDPRDHDARSSARKFEAARAESSLHGALSRAQTAAERARDLREGLERPDDLGRSVQVQHTPDRHRIVAHVDGPLNVAGRILVPHLTVEVRRGEKLWLRGPNGVGKSTLLRALLATSPVPIERRMVLPQELDEPAIQDLVDRLQGLPPDRRGAVLGLVAALGVAPERLLASARPSPGEGRKLALALGLADDRALLALDEPTHHLDLPSRRRLQQALLVYPGTVLLVTHDLLLGEAVCTRAIDLGS